MSLGSHILRTLKRSSVPLDDDELAQALGVVRQQINQAARGLEKSKKLIRVKGPEGKLINILNDRPGRKIAATLERTPPSPSGSDSSRITEDEVKLAIRDHLASQGYQVEVAWDRSPGIDIEACRGEERLVIEAKGEASLQPQQHNYFVNALGELVQRMDDAHARYGLALPNHRQYHGLVERLPQVARNGLNFVVFWVERGPDGPRVTNDTPPGKRRRPWWGSGREITARLDGPTGHLCPRDSRSRIAP